MLRKKTSILVKQAARLMGILDEYRVLEPNQVYVSFKEGEHTVVKSGRVVVTRNPCLHPGDIRVLEAVDSDYVRGRLGKYDNCIVFSQVGEFPVPFMISGGDLDGDLYFVSWDERLIPPKTVECMNYSDSKQLTKIDN